jgi:hypothetical protein
MLLIDVHKLQVILAQPIALAALEDQVQDIRSILSFDCQDIFALGGAQDLSEGCEVHAERNITIASVWGEGFGLEHHGDERDVRVVHGLEGDTGVIAVEVAVLDEILDCIDDLWESVKALKGYEHATDLFQHICLLETCFQHCGQEVSTVAHRIPFRGGGCAYS